MKLLSRGDSTQAQAVANAASAHADRLSGASETTSGLLLGAVRSLMRVHSKEEVVGVLMDAVRDLGGMVTSAQHQSFTTLSIDLSFGVGEPLFPDSPDPKVNSLLNSVLPALVDDALLAIERIETMPFADPDGDTDPLTGLGNWSFTMRVLGRMTPGDAVAIFDLENIKHINDYFGPASGDQVTLAFARTLRRVARAADTVGRVGSTEFVWLFRGTTPAGAESALGRLRSMWEAERPHDVTFAAGLSIVGTTGPNEAYMYSDVAVQTAKRNGINHTVVSR